MISQLWIIGMAYSDSEKGIIFINSSAGRKGTCGRDWIQSQKTYYFHNCLSEFMKERNFTIKRPDMAKKHLHFR